MTSVSIDVTAIPPRPAGAGRYVLELARRLPAVQGLEVSLLTRRDDAERWGTIAPGARVLALAPRRRPTRVVWEQLLLGPALSIAAGGAPDVHHSPHYSMPLWSPAPVVVTIHDLTFIDHPEWHERSKVVVFAHAIRRAARRAAALICVSEATRARLVELLAPDCPVHVVPHGVDTAEFAATEPAAGADAAALARLGVRPPYVLHLGTIEPRKDVPTLLRAFDGIAAERPELTLVLAGHRGWGTSQLAATLEGLRHRDRVVRLGYVEAELLPALLRRAGAVAYPSQEEGFGLPALEALACGAPLVTTAGSAMSDVTGDAALLVPAGDPAALGGALAQLLDGAGGTAGRRERGLAVAERHSWVRTASEHGRIYAEVAAAGRRRRGRSRSAAAG